MFAKTTVARESSANTSLGLVASEERLRGLRKTRLTVKTQIAAFCPFAQGQLTKTVQENDGLCCHRDRNSRDASPYKVGPRDANHLHLENI